jgi:hypothetical protein
MAAELSSKAMSSQLVQVPYVIIAKDANGCLGSTVSVNVTAPLPITLVSATVGACINNLGSITLVASGGTGTLQYSLNGGIFQTSPVFTGLANGSYTVTIKDNNNCTFTAANTVLVSCQSNGGQIVCEISCNGGTATLTVNVTGGVTPYTYSIDNGVTFQSSNIFNGLTTGIYTVIVKDAVGTLYTTAPVTVNTVAIVDITATATLKRSDTMHWRYNFIDCISSSWWGCSLYLQH